MGILVSDTFTEATTTALASHTPDTGTGWTEDANDTEEEGEVDAGDFLSFSGDFEGYAQYSSQPDATAADVDVSLDFNVAGSAFFLFLRGTGSTQWYGLRIEDGQLNIYKWVSPTLTSLDVQAAAYSVTDRIKLSIRGADIEGLVDPGSGFVVQVSATDSTITAAGTAGVAFGKPDAGGDDINSAIQVDNYVLEEFPAGGGVILRHPLELFRHNLTR